MTDQNKALLVTVADPFNAFKSRKLVNLEVGKTICETLVEQGYVSMTADGMTRNGYFFVTLNGEAVLQADWNTVINDEDCLGIWTLPQGGGGGSNIGAIIITVVMVAAAVFTGGATLGVALAWGAAAGAAVGLLSSMVPAPSTPSSGSSIGKDTASSTYTISAQGNSVRVGEAIPSQYGRMRVWPDLAAQPYTEIRGNEQYVYQLMVLGQGAYEVERIQIEDSDIKAYGEVQWEVIQPNQQVTLFPDNVITSQAVQGLEMLAPDEQGFAVLGPYVSSPPGVKVNFIAVDIQLPQGAYKVDDEGNNLPRSVQISFWTQPINDAGAPAGAQIQIVSETLTFSTKTPQMISYKVAVPEGRYQTSGQRTSNKPVDNRTVDKVIWSGLKGYGKSARTFGNVTMLATIIKATNNLNSNTSRRINVIQTRKLPTWDPVNGWKAEVATANPAWAYADALRNADYGPAWGTNRINMSEIYRLSQVWAARKDEFNGIFDTRTTLWQALTQIAMVGRATPQYYAGVMDLIRDEPKTIPAQIFGPGQILQNTFKGSYKLGTSQTPDHVIVKFWNRETWQEDEITCVLPGSTTKVPYTKDMTFGITDRDHAWREGMYAAAVNRDQRSRNSFTTEMEGLLLRFGDLIHVTHDVPGWGLPGKVVSFNPTTGKIVTTEPLTFSAAATHYITFRKKNGKADGPWPIIADPNPVAGVNSAIVQGTVANRQKIFISNGVTTDLTSYAFGPADRESNKMVVLSAKPNANGETQLTVCDYVTSPHIADQGGDVPPPGPISNLPGQPVGPIVNSVRVEMTTTVGEQQIVADPANGAIYYEFEGMRQGGGNWSAFGVSGDPFLFVNLDSGPWIIRVRAVGAIPGPWATWSGNIAATSLPLAKLSKFVATGKIFAIDLSFDYAEETRSIAKTLEIWAGRTNVLGNSTLLVKLPYPATAYTHSVNRGADQWYYFARVIDSAGRVGPWFNNGGGIPGMSSMDADPILDQIAGEVTKDILGQELQKEIELITAPSTVVGSVNQRVNDVKVDLSNQIQDLSTVVNQNKQDVATLKQNVSDINSQIITISKAGLYQANQTYATGKAVRTTDDRLYTAIKAVPVNTPPPNSAYWLDVGQVAINENGSAAKITTLTTRVGTVENTQTAQATLINGLRTDVDGKASQTAFNSLDSKVTTMGNTVNALGQAVTSLESSVGGIGGENWIYNPSFEKAGANGLADGWAMASAAGATASTSLVPSALATGEVAQRMDVTGITTSVWARIGNPSAKRIEIRPGMPVTMSAYVRGTAGIAVRCEIQFLNSAGGGISGVPVATNASLTADFKRISHSVIAPEGAVNFNYFVTIYGTAGVSAGFIEVDRSQIEFNTIASGWHDNGQVSNSNILANSSAVTALTTRVVANETGLTSLSQQITEVKASIGGAGTNMLPSQYSVFDQPLPALGGSSFTATLVDDPASFASKVLKFDWSSTSNGLAAFFAPTATIGNMGGERKKYIISYRAKASVAGHVIALPLRGINADGSVYNTPGAVQQALTTDWQRYFYVADMTSASFTGDKMLLWIQMNRSAVANRSIWIDQIMVEEQKGENLNPSSFTPGNSAFQTSVLATSVDALNATVSQQGSNITSVSNRTTTLENAINNPTSGLNSKASATSVTSLGNRVTATEQGLTAATSSITNLSTSMSLLGASGVNLVPAEYCAFTKTMPAMYSNAGVNMSTVVDAFGLKGYVLKADNPNPASHTFGLNTGFNAAGCNMGFKPGKYIVSFYARSETDGHQVGAYVRGLLADGVNFKTSNAPVVTLTTSWARYSGIIDLTDPAYNGAQMQLAIQSNRSNVANRVTYFDRFMLEAAVNDQVNPSVFAMGNSFDQIQVGAEATAALSARVTQNEQGITSLSGNVVSLTNSIGQVGGENWIYNSSFEKAGTGGLADGWAVGSAASPTITPSIVASALALGEFAQRANMTGLTTSAWARIGNPSNRRISVTPGTPITMSAFVRGTSGIVARCEIQFLDSSGGGISSTTAQNTPLTGTYSRISHSVIVPDGAVNCNYFVTCYGATTSAISGFIEIDRTQMEGAPMPTGWKDNGQVLSGNQAGLSTAIDALNSSVSQQGTSITSVANRTTALENSVNSTTNGLATKASASSVTTLGNRVTATEQGLTSTSNSVTVLANTISQINGGVNLVPTEYSIFGATPPSINRQGGMTLSTVANSSALGKYLMKLESATSQVNYFYLAANGTDWTMKLKPGKKYILSFWVQADAARVMSLRIRYPNAAGSNIETELATVNVTTELTRVSAVMTMPAALVDNCCLVFYQARTASASTHWYDGFMLEEQIGDNQVPSSFSASNSSRQYAAAATAITSVESQVSNVDGKLTAQVTRIDNLSTQVGAANTAIQDERTARINGDGALGQRIDTTQTNINNVSASVQTISTAQTNLRNEANASFAVKLGVTSNGIYYASGFGQSLVNANGMIQSTFAVLTDRFVVLNTTNNTLVSPFSIVNGQVIIRDALISNAAIMNAIIGNSLRSAAVTNWPGKSEPVMTMDFNAGNVITRSVNGNETYSIMDAAGFRQVVNGALVFRAGTW